MVKPCNPSPHIQGLDLVGSLSLRPVLFIVFSPENAIAFSPNMNTISFIFSWTKEAQLKMTINGLEPENQRIAVKPPRLESMFFDQDSYGTLDYNSSPKHNHYLFFGISKHVGKS